MYVDNYRINIIKYESSLNGHNVKTVLTIKKKKIIPKRIETEARR